MYIIIDKRVVDIFECLCTKIYPTKMLKKLLYFYPFDSRQQYYLGRILKERKTIRHSLVIHWGRRRWNEFIF